ncbi:ABC transporter permease [Sinosporangium siamense]|uniref:Transport permease YfiN n=1 Tax=Sinosporangium siamense TaxID=1367973 RepID=A0A919RF79_9ACTN|nr:ABC transporter permease [Sinosporangium siamense]GII90669.1 putative transport permease YfiN [Sinosporangium siamense]
MKVLAIAMVNLRRVFREKTNIFFIVITPIATVLMMGLLFGGGQEVRLGVVSGPGPLAERLVKAVSEGERIRIERVGSEAELRSQIERGVIQAGLTLPANYDQELLAGRNVAVSFVARPGDPQALELGVWVRSVGGQEGALLRAARFGTAEGKGSFEQTLAAAEKATVPGIEISVRTTGKALFPAGFNSFALSAPSLMIMFMFLTSLTAAIGIIETRLLGVSRRMYSTPTPVGVLVAGESLGRILIALVQGLLVMIGSALIFGVNWGDPFAAAVLLVVFSLVGGGAALLLGSVFHVPGPAISLALLLGLGLAALGGVMVPLESFSGTMQAIAHITPHAWAYEAFAELVRHGGGVADILPQLGVLLAFAAVLFGIGMSRLRQALIH